MLRIYQYNNPYQYKDFESYLFTSLRPQFDHANDKLLIDGTEYRISTINYLGLFNRMLDNQVQYTLSLGASDFTYAVLHHDSNFQININPKLAGCLIHLKVKKTTADDITIALPVGSYGADVVSNQLVLSGNVNQTFILSAVYEGGEYDWLVRDRATGFGASVIEWNDILNIPSEFTPAAHTHVQLHDQHTDYQILYTEPTIPTYVFGASTSSTQPINVKELSIHFDGADKFVSEIIMANNSVFDKLEVFEDGVEIRNEDFSLIYIDSRYRHYLNNPFKAYLGKTYSLRFYRSDGVAQGLTLYTASDYNEQGIPYYSVPFTVDYIDNNDVEIMGLTRTPVYFLRGSEFSKVVADKSKVKVIAETLDVEANTTIRKNLVVEGNIIQQGIVYETHAEQLYSTKDMILMRDGAIAGLAVNELSGFRILNYDGTNNLALAAGNDGVARVGDESGTLQALATREDNPLDGGYARWNTTTLRFECAALDLSGYALVNHSHSEYALNTHNHNGVYLGISAKAADSNLLDGIDSSSFLRSNANDSFTGKLTQGSTSTRQAGLYGVYDSYKVAHIWSMGTSYVLAADGSGLGNLYGAAYAHSNAIGTYANSHQFLWVVNGSIYAAIGTDIWTRGAIRLNEGTSRRASLYYDATNNYVMLHNNAQDNGLKIYDLDGRAVFGGKCYATDFEQSSDRRLKKKIQPLTKGIEGLKPVSFEWINKQIPGLNYGFIAQDMAKTHPELVTISENGKLAIKQNSIIAMLVLEVHELKNQIKKLRKQ